MSSQWTRHNKIKAGVWATAFAAVIAVGSLTGAQLKSDTQKREQITQFREISPSEQIAALQDQRKGLMEQRGMLQRKLDAFRDTVREREGRQKK